jgi:ribosomal-protein-alanine N-acetyltransferase
MSAPIAVGERALLHHLSIDDQAEFIAAARASRELHGEWVDPADTPERFVALIRRAQNPEFHPFVIRRADGVLAGFVNVSNVVRGGFQSAFCGYAAFAGSDGRGVMTSGLGLVVRFAFGEIGLHRVEANIQPTNLPSIALAERVGFRYEGFSPRYLKIAGEWRDHNRYAMTAEDLG